MGNGNATRIQDGPIRSASDVTVDACIGVAMRIEAHRGTYKLTCQIASIQRAVGD